MGFGSTSYASSCDIYRTDHAGEQNSKFPSMSG